MGPPGEAGLPAISGVAGLPSRHPGRAWSDLRAAKVGRVVVMLAVRPRGCLGAGGVILVLATD